MSEQSKNTQTPPRSPQVQYILDKIKENSNENHLYLVRQAATKRMLSDIIQKQLSDGEMISRELIDRYNNILRSMAHAVASEEGVDNLVGAVVSRADDFAKRINDAEKK